MASPDAMDRRRFLAWLARTGLAVAALPSVPGWARAARFPETSRAWRVMGTWMEVRVPDLSPAEAIAAIRGVRREVESLEAVLTLYRPESPLVAFNAGAAGRWMDVPPELAHTVDRALAAHGESEGAFDPSLVPAMRAWGLHDLRGHEPPAEFRREWRRRPGTSAVEVDRAGCRMRRFDPRVELDLGGIGKGVAVDGALAILHRAGSRSALVNLGGQIGVLGAPPERPAGWPVGIAHPLRPGETCHELDLAAGHLATSGISERWVETPSGRKHHLLDPVSGEPVPGVASLSVWARSGIEADVLSTARFVQAARGELGGDHVIRHAGFDEHTRVYLPRML